MDTRAHAGLEEAIGPPPVGLGFIHRQIGILEQVIQIGAVLRCHRDADAGVGGQEMAEALIGFADRVINPRDQFHGVGRPGDARLDDCEFVTAEPGHDVIGRNAGAQPASYRLQQLVADGMSERDR